MVGVDNLKKLAADSAGVLNVVSEVVHGWKLFALLKLVGPVSDLRNVDFAAAKQELLDLDAGERAQVEAAFNSALSLQDPAVQAKIVAAEGYLERAIELVGRGVALGTDAVALVKDVRAYLGV